MFGVDAELLIDHAWGRESTTMEDIKEYRPKNSSFSSGQVLPRDYSFDECELIIKEMTDALCLDMSEKGMVTQSVTLVIGYSNKLLLKPATGTAFVPVATNCYRVMIPYVLELYERIVQRDKPIRRVSVTCNSVMSEGYEQYDLLTDYTTLERDRRLQKATLEIKKRFGKNALLRGMDLLEAGTTIERNQQIGGHKSGE